MSLNIDAEAYSWLHRDTAGEASRCTLLVDPVEGRVQSLRLHLIGEEGHVLGPGLADAVQQVDGRDIEYFGLTDMALESCCKVDTRRSHTCLGE